MTRQLHITAAAAALVLAAAPVHAQTVNTTTQQLAFNGVAAPGCIMLAASSPDSDNASLTSSTPGAADILIDQLVGADGVPVGATVVLTLPAACNQAHVLTMGSQNGGLVNPDGASVASPFRALLPYAATVAWASGSETYDSANPAVTISQGDAAVGSITVTIEIPAGGAPLVAGAYSDQLVLELAAAG